MTNEKNIEIVLASGSPRRKELLKNIFHKFSVITSEADESLPDNIELKVAPEYLAKIKAEAVQNSLKSSENTLIIGADTVVLYNNRIFGKPESYSDAETMLESLSGKTHEVITGCCLIYNNKIHTFSQTTKVTFYDLDKDEIRRYIESKEPMDKAGGYGIQGMGSLLVKEINGDYFNVVGLPVSRLYREIKCFI